MEWEGAKENFVPVKQGHSAATLTTPVPITKRNQELEEAKKSYLEDIKAADDPLAAWQRYIKWTQEQFATQGSKTELQQVLEAATKSLSTTSRYKNDVRLLRVWVQYADCLPDPNDVFLYLESHCIGRDHALFYEAYATYLELKGNFKQAGLVYQEGINRLARPLERLKLKHTAFQQRMEKRIQRQTSDALLGIEAASDSSTARATLAPVSGLLGQPQLDENGNLIRSSRQHSRQNSNRVAPQEGTVAAGIRPASNSSTRPNIFGGSMPTSTASGLFGLGRTSNSSSHSTSCGAEALVSKQGTTNAVQPFTILVDDEFGPTGSGVQPTAFPASQQQQHSQLPGYKTSRKENTTEAAEWAGQKMKQQAIYTAPAASKLEVCEDEDFAEADAAQVDQQSVPQQAGLRQRLELPYAEQSGGNQNKAVGVGQSSLLARGAAGLLAAAQQQKQCEHAAPSASAAPTHRSARNTAAVNAHTVNSANQAADAVTARPQGYDPALLVDSDGSEVSFEEVRAKAWRRTHAQQQQQQQEQQGGLKQTRQPMQAQPPPAELQHTQQPMQTQQQQPVELKHTQQRMQRQQTMEPGSQHTLTSHPDGMRGCRLVPQYVEQAPKTTASVMSVSDKVPQSQAIAYPHKQQQQAHCGVGNEMTEQQMQQQMQQQSAAADPTVTVNTREALESLNFMFSQDLPTMTLPRNTISSAATAVHAATAAGSRGSRLPAGSAVEPTVTINTRAAFDAMNGIFGCEDDTTTMHPFAGRGRSVAAEPTVTINTRNAFNCMNDIFADVTGQQTLTGQAMLSGRATQKGGRPPAPAPAAGSWQLHEDTELLQCAKGLMGNRPGMVYGHDNWEVREDTEFVGATSRMGAAGLGAGLGVCEDTEFITRPVDNAAASSSGLAVYEDTDYLNVPVIQASTGMDRLSLANRAAGVGSSRVRQGAGLELHEDTDVLTRPSSRPSASTCGVGRTAGTSGKPCYAQPGTSRDQENVAEAGHKLGLHEDTELLTCSMSAAGARSGLSLHEDTDLLPSYTARGGLESGPTTRMNHSLQQKSAHSTGLALDIREDTELLTNHAGGGKIHSDHAASTSRAAVLDTCSDTTTGLLRIKENLPSAVVSRSQRPPLGLSATATIAGPHGSSRLGHSSAPGSPVGPHRPTWGTAAAGKPPLSAATPGRHPTAHSTPNRMPSTPGTPWARPMEDFEVMESPAARQAMAGQRVMQMSPATSVPSPGVGSLENLPADENHDVHLKPRSMHDRGAMAAALQPLSKSRADILGVCIEPTDPGREVDEDRRGSPTAVPCGDVAADLGTGAVGRQRPNALRSLRFQA